VKEKQRCLSRNACKMVYGHPRAQYLPLRPLGAVFSLGSCEVAVMFLHAMSRVIHEGRAGESDARVATLLQPMRSAVYRDAGCVLVRSD